MEGMQECEAKIFIEKALLAEGSKARLGDEFTAKCWKILDARRELQIALAGAHSHWLTSTRWPHDAYHAFKWQTRSEELYSAAAEVAKTMEPAGNQTAKP